jgi:hypothetical protein
MNDYKMKSCIKEDIQHEINVIELQYIRNSIESMAKINQVEILRILHKHTNIILNENKYGVHVNLTDLEPYIILELKNYIQYVQEQENNLLYIETQKNNMKLLFTTENSKDMTSS